MLKLNDKLQKAVNDCKKNRANKIATVKLLNTHIKMDPRLHEFEKEEIFNRF